MYYNYDKSLFNDAQRELIAQVVINGGSKEILDIMTLLNDNGKPVFNAEQLFEIRYGIAHGFPEKFIKEYCKITDDKKAIYDENQMSVITIFFEENISDEIINIIMRTENDVPIFNEIEMQHIFNFATDADDKQKQQFIECVEAGMRFNDFAPFLNHLISSECMRIYKDLHLSGFDRNNIERIIKNETNYEYLKEVKYLFNCCKTFKIKQDNIFTRDSVDIEDWRYNLSSIICMRFSTMREHKESVAMVSKFLSFRIEPEQIMYIMDPFNEFSTNDKKDVAIGFLNGLSIDEVEKCISEPSSSLKESINNFINKKILNAYNLDEITEIKTDYFDEIEGR